MVVGGPGGLDGHGYGERGGKLRGRRVDPPAAVRSPLPRVLDVPPRRVLPPAAGLRPSLPPSGAPASGAASMAELRRRRCGLDEPGTLQRWCERDGGDQNDLMHYGSLCSLQAEEIFLHKLS